MTSGRTHVLPAEWQEGSNKEVDVGTEAFASNPIGAPRTNDASLCRSVYRLVCRSAGNSCNSTATRISVYFARTWVRRVCTCVTRRHSLCRRERKRACVYVYVHAYAYVYEFTRPMHRSQCTLRGVRECTGFASSIYPAGQNGAGSMRFIAPERLQAGARGVARGNSG